MDDPEVARIIVKATETIDQLSTELQEAHQLLALALDLAEAYKFQRDAAMALASDMHPLTVLSTN